MEAPGLLTPMPGTTLPLDPFDEVELVTAPSVSKLEREDEVEASFAESSSNAETSEKMARLHALKSPNAGHVDHKTGEWHSDDPLNIPSEEDSIPNVHSTEATIERMYQCQMPPICMCTHKYVSADPSISTRTSRRFELLNAWMPYTWVEIF